MKILITGGNGYKGTVLIPRLLQKGHFIRSIDTNWFGDYLIPHKNLEKIKCDIRELKNDHLRDIDCVIHLANIANDPQVDLNPQLSWEVNVLGSQLLAQLCVQEGVKQLIFASSGSVYGVSKRPKVTEDTPLVPISAYNKTKMVAERIFLSYKDSINIICVRPATVCGVSPRMRLDVSVNILTYSALKNGCINVFGGNQIRPNIHIDDICSLYEFFLGKETSIPSGFFNAGFENISILDIANRIKLKLPDCEIKISESNDPRSYRQCSDKIINYGFQPKKNVDNAIKEIIDAYNSGELNDDDTCFSIKQLKSKNIK
tara:strand:+ start:2943 stop:3890 length:948 start_codon:yes stop_codon:yes gene_type:complete